MIHDDPRMANNSFTDCINSHIKILYYRYIGSWNLTKIKDESFSNIIQNKREDNCVDLHNWKLRNYIIYYNIWIWEVKCSKLLSALIFNSHLCVIVVWRCLTLLNIAIYRGRRGKIIATFSRVYNFILNVNNGALCSYTYCYIGMIRSYVHWQIYYFVRYKSV